MAFMPVGLPPDDLGSKTNRIVNLIHQHLESEPDPAVIGNGVALWTILDNESLPAWAPSDCLSESEADRYRRTNHVGAKERFRRGRILLRNVLGRVLKRIPKDVPLTLGEYGKPMVEGIQFNMSHTDGVLILALSHRIIGIDVEAPSPDRDIHGLVNRYFSDIEQKQFAALPATLQPEAFIRGWTCKEALLKALGTGVRDLQNVSVDLAPRLPPQVLECPGMQKWELECWKIGEASAALCATINILSEAEA